MDHMGSSEFLTSDVTKRVTSWTSYDEWGNITHNAVLKCGTRELDLVKNYTGHERDSVLGMYYAKARMYDTADKHGSTKGNKLGDKRFMAVDPVKGNVRNPQSMVQYTYVLNNPLLYVDPLGLWTAQVEVGGSASAGASGGKSFTAVIDGKGNIAILENYNYGGGSLDVSISATGAVTSAPDYKLLVTGNTLNTGGSISVYTADYITITDSETGEVYKGLAVGGTFGLTDLAIPLEVHARTSTSKVVIALNPAKQIKKTVNNIERYLRTIQEVNYEALPDEDKKIIDYAMNMLEQM